MEVIGVLFLIGIAIYTYIDHQDPDNKAKSIHPFDHETVNANNERKRKQIEVLEDKARKLNYSNTTKEFYRQGANILERERINVARSWEHTQQAYYDGSQQYDVKKRVESRFLAGITEYPTVISFLDLDMAYTENAQSVVITVDASNLSNKKYLDLEHLKEVLSWENHSRLEIGKWIDCIQIDGINEDQETATYDIVITIPDKVVLTDEYIAHEIGNIGRVFLGNHINSSRYLPPSLGKNRIERRNGRLMAYVDRRQTVNSFLDGQKQRVMSEKQITRNIKNRLLNRVDVKCLSIDNNTYCGEILVI